MVEVQFLEGTRDISLFHSIQTGSGAHPATYTVGTGDSFGWDVKGLFPRGKAARE
jgi:hypothetical protein